MGTVLLPAFLVLLNAGKRTVPMPAMPAPVLSA